LKILITGGKGQLGTDLNTQLSLKHQIYSMGKEDIDITDLDKVIDLVRKIKPNLMINAAAYTNVDGCETETDVAYKINAVGAKNLAISALESDSKLLHISTDFVFDGKATSPYIEFDAPNPLSIYGKSKLAGEQCIKDICSKYYILRTSWLYGKNGTNFVKTMLRLAEERQYLNVVDDQIGTPTYTIDLVNMVETLIQTDAYGTYHASNDGQCSWNEFAKRIFQFAEKNDISVLPIRTEELNRPASRPKYSVMRNYMMELQLNYRVRHWEEALREYFDK